MSAAETDQLADLESLAEWLRLEPGLRGAVQWRAEQTDPTRLSAGEQILAVSVGSGGALTVLAASLKAWLGQPRRATVRIRLHGPGKQTVEIDLENVRGRDVAALLGESLRPVGDRSQ